MYSNNAFDDDDENPHTCQKVLVKEDMAPKKISHMQFGLLSASDMQRLSEFQVCSSDLFTMPARTPAHGGCLDSRLGVSDKFSVCETCNRKLEDCAGHYGYIRLALPVYHIGFIKHTLEILQCICKTCSRVLLMEQDREKILNKMRNPRTDALAKTATYKKVRKLCEKAKEKMCPHCGHYNGAVKKISGVPTIKIIHERYKCKNKHEEEEVNNLIDRLESAMQINNDIANIITGATIPFEDITPARALELLSNITDDDCEVLWYDPMIGRPENLILQNILVPPVPIRPSVAMDNGGGSNENDLTSKLQDIITINIALELSLTKGPHTKTIKEQWDVLQVQVAQYINGDIPGIQRPMDFKPMRGLCQRLKGKQGRFRGNLSGKRVNFSARTVISPDPNLACHKVGVPRQTAMKMTYPEKVTRVNLKKLQRLVKNGPDVHPGANEIGMRDGFTKSLAFGDRVLAAKNLRFGDIVYRHMEDGDIVLFNRQPSLHKVSIMSHQVKVMEWRTFRFNTCVCAPYNADFDGDEMNMHLPQTEEARTEAQYLMGVRHNLITPRNGEPLVAANQDFVSGSYLLTQKDRFFTREQFCQLTAYLGDADEAIDIPHPAILKPVELWTGKQIFGVMVRPNKSSKVLVNCELKDKNYSKNKYFCKNDGWVAFRNSELISGNIAKKTIGDGSKTGLLYVLLRDWGEAEASRILDRWAKFCSRWMGNHRGFSIGISDVTPSDVLQKMKYEILLEGYNEADANLEKYEKKELDLRPGCDLLQSLEEILNGVLGRLRKDAGDEATKILPWSNSPRIMADCGSKGSPLNISQMIACVGQQAVDGKRIQNGFVNRTLPHFEYHSLTPSAKGFVANSFYTGLTATEFIFHAMGGREGLVDTAVKTAETGYMSRKVMKALEDLSMQYDATVRNSENTVVQFTYGDDGLHPEKMEDNDRPVDFERLRMHLNEIEPCADEPALIGSELLDLVEAKLCEKRFRELLPTGFVFLQEIRDYFAGITKKQAELMSMGILPGKNLERAMWNSCRFTRRQLELFLASALEKCTIAGVEPGEAVGAIGAQSISEPGTQMTLKTFHFSGISSMNVTLGVPRLKEIINAAKKISTPIITVKLEQDDNKVAARIVKAVIEKTTLGEVSKYMKEVYAPGSCYISVELDMNTIDQLKINLDASGVRMAILNGTLGVTMPDVLKKLKPSHVKVKNGSNSKLRVYVPDLKDSQLYFVMQRLKTALPNVIVQGIPSVHRAVIKENEAKNGKPPTYDLLVEGEGLLNVMGSPGIDGLHTSTNNVFEVEQVLGIEAARTSISAEISYIMNAYGIGIDYRHLLLLSDVMTFKGEVLGINRHGIRKMRESVLMLASFETPTDHLFDAAVHGRADEIVGVSECIIMGIPIQLGTGLPYLYWDPSKLEKIREENEFQQQ